jgi:hypothetical protein
MHEGLRRPFRDAKNFGDFLVGTVFVVAEHDRRAPFGPKLAQRGVERFRERGRFDRIGRLLDDRLGRIGSGPAIEISPAQRVDGGVVGYPQHPAGESAVTIEPTQAAEGLEERVLRDIFGVRGIAEHPMDQVEDGPLVAPDDFLERRLRAGDGLRDELRIRQALQVARDGCPLSGHTSGRQGGFHRAVHARPIMIN